MSEYNGHPSKAAWNVALWINNDEDLYNFALECIAKSENIDAAASMFVMGVTEKTPDGFPFSHKHVKWTFQDLA